MSDMEDNSSLTPDSENSIKTLDNPIPTPHIFLPVTFENPQIPGTERLFANVLVDNLFIYQTLQVIGCRKILATKR